MARAHPHPRDVGVLLKCSLPQPLALVWGWRKTLRRAAKITGRRCAPACMAASAGLCAGATAGAIAAGVAWDGYQKRKWG